MTAFFGLLLIALGGFASGSFYVPLKFVKKWSWESMWMVYAVCALIIMPTIAAYAFMPTFTDAIAQADKGIILGTFGFGMLWGIGGLTFGLSMRYLGVGLGGAVAMGFCSAFGTMIPLAFEKGHLGDFSHIVDFGAFWANFDSRGGMIVFSGIILSLVGIAINGYAGLRKEKDDARKNAQGKGGETSKDFSLTKGFLIAFFAGVASAGFAFALEKGASIGDNAAAMAVTKGIWNETFAGLFKSNAIYIVLLWGGFTVNFCWCLFLMLKNKTIGDYAKAGKGSVRNTGLGALSGLLWFLQFFLFGMGKYYMGEKYSFAAWSILMALVIVFSVFWGLFTKEWANASRKTLGVLALGVVVLIASGCMMGMGGAF